MLAEPPDGSSPRVVDVGLVGRSAWWVSCPGLRFTPGLGGYVARVFVPVGALGSCLGAGALGVQVPLGAFFAGGEAV